MNLMKKPIVLLLVVAVSGAVYFAYIALNRPVTNVGNKEVQAVNEQTQMVGGDRDEHGCIGSAGYIWCEEKQKCLRAWEEACPGLIDANTEEELKVQIKRQIVEKRGEGANKLDISVSTVQGKYAKGGASAKDMGGGMWFAAKVNGEWSLVWDGNGIISCRDLSAYPDFPNSMIPQCFDETTNVLKSR